ncbi:MAG: hypothetical protein IJ297_00715 [Clostridia bacterium]|nr:hypothetical protein [Clostridia bacterium]
MKKRILSLFLIVMIAVSSLGSITSAAAASVYAMMNSDSLTSGTLTATIYYSGDESVKFVLGYYSKDDILLDCISTVFLPTEDSTNTTLSLEIPQTVAGSDYAKLVGMYPDSLEPVNISGRSIIYCQKPVMGVDTVFEGMNERYYTISSPEGSLSVSKRVVSVAEEGTLFRLKDMTEGYVAFEDYTTPKYRLEYTEENGVRVYFYSAGSAKQRWIMEKYNDGYTLESANGGYLAIKDGAVTVQDEKYEWSVDYAGETPFSLMTSTDAFKLFTEKQQQRIIDICTSIGADAMPYAPNADSFLDDCEKVFTKVYYEKYTAEDAKALILDAVSKPVIGELAESGFYYPLQSFPGSDAVITQGTPVKTKHVMWDLVEENGVIYSASEEHPYTGAAINCYRIDVTYTTSDTTQNVAVYCVDPSFANVQTAISALGKFPYAYRQHIKNMYVYLSTTTSTYNCGGEELFVRLKGTANETTMIKSFAHELGHSNDYMANGDVNNRGSHWSQGTKWQLAVEDDIATISTYGNSNSDEGFAEFARLYWLCYGNRDLQIGIKQLYPNRFASFQRMLAKIGCTGEILY